MQTNKEQLKQIYLFSFLSSAVIVLFTFEDYVGIGITLCAIINSALLFWLLRNKEQTTNKKAFLWLVPLLLLSFSYVLRANRMLHALNVIVAALLICAMLLDLQNKLNFFSGGFAFLAKSICSIFTPFAFIGKFFANLPVLFGAKKQGGKLQKILLGLLICIPIIYVVLALLSSADAIFHFYLNNISLEFKSELLNEITSKTIFIIIFAIYIFGHLFIYLVKKEKAQPFTANGPIYGGINANISTAQTHGAFSAQNAIENSALKVQSSGALNGQSQSENTAANETAQSSSAENITAQGESMHSENTAANETAQSSSAENITAQCESMHSENTAANETAESSSAENITAQGESMHSENTAANETAQSTINNSAHLNNTNSIIPPVYSANAVYGANAMPKKEPEDLIIFTMVNVSLMVIYAFFAYIQVNYLFLGTALPEGFTYSEYARQGFFELLILTFINVTVLLLTINFAKKRLYETKVSGSAALKIIMALVCALTMFLLYSSFYKMVLYHNEYGLTRLRLLVMIFLAFEALGLLITLAFIFKPNIKIIACYTVICLVFYISVNLINIDGIIAKNHIDNYLQTGDKLDYSYLAYLSADANDELMRLNSIEYDYELYTGVINKYYSIDFDEHTIKVDFIGEKPNTWQSYNISYSKALAQK